MNYTIKSFSNKVDQNGQPKRDKMGNYQLDIIFEEDQRHHYMASKDPSKLSIGQTLNGDIIDGEYGTRFKREYAQPGNFGGMGYNTPGVGERTAPQPNIYLGNLESGRDAQLRDMGHPANVEQNQILDGVRKTYAKLVEVEKKVDKLMYGEPETTPEKVVADMSQPIPLDEIPF